MLQVERKDKKERLRKRKLSAIWNSCFFANNGETQRKQWKQQKRGKLSFLLACNAAKEWKDTLESSTCCRHTQKKWIESRHIQKAEAEWKKDTCCLPGSPTAFPPSCYFARNVRKEEKWWEKVFPYSFRNLQSSTLNHL